MPKRAYRFDLFYKSLVSLKNITHTCQLPAPKPPSHLLSSSALSLTCFNPRFDFLEYILVYFTSWRREMSGRRYLREVIDRCGVSVLDLDSVWSDDLDDGLPLSIT
ncbi:hypothetical protein ACTXT7_012125, partial [Hymenolepis weldensis]